MKKMMKLFTYYTATTSLLVRPYRMMYYLLIIIYIILLLLMHNIIKIKIKITTEKDIIEEEGVLY